MRTVSVATLVCVASWLGLAVGAGYVGLSRAVALSPLTLLEAPSGIALAFAAAFAVTWLAGRLDPSRTPAPLALAGAVVVGDVVGAIVLAPLAVGELEPMHAPVVFVAISALGAQPIAAFLGARLWRAPATQA